ncbi:hypothetical protein RFW18_07220 [Metabacillus idriensis]|uniref:hypothetical protein n=1 Tax=Metabacillus idriensis TaxID=324768 RepID=UPI002812B41C|nr:hypothetical protein [Metabacillus idriensis]MDR0137537.1 hypothetical protein [Metabacillus idriensis]
MMNNYQYGYYPANWQQEEPFETREDAMSTCRRHMNFYVIARMTDGSQVEGIIEDMDNEGVTMMIPEEVEESEMDANRQYGYRRRFRRYRRRRFPYYAFIFPFFIPYPFYY